MDYINNIANSILDNYDNNVLFIDNKYHSYKEFALCISNIRDFIQNTIPNKEKLIGLVTNDDIETYASIVALWLEGKAYVPVNPEFPAERNFEIFRQTKTKFVLDSSNSKQYNGYNTIDTTVKQNIKINLTPKKINGEDLAYILFTSGTTGVPKGVPITFNNVQALVNAVDAEPTFNLNNKDKCLQMFELTFDFSVVTYLFPLLAGSCIYTIPKGKIKYFYIFKLLKEQNLTVLTMVPSIINYLRPYFPEINAKSVRYCSFGGGALHDDIAKEWSNCLPNCKIFNYYGPTEFTVYSGFYPYDKDTHTKAYNGVISIGKPQKDTLYLVVNKNNEEVAIGEAGELCLAGPQITPGYWNNDKKNKLSFFYHRINGINERFYKTGDLCIIDEDGDYLYVGRSDFQVKIRGYRVELGEVEFHTKKVIKDCNFVVLDIDNDSGNNELYLIIESDKFNIEPVVDYLKEKMPNYMVPTQIRFIDSIPHNINGKIDRNQLRNTFNP